MYDVIIIGSGVAGVFAAYRLSQSNKKILLIDKGTDLPERLNQLALKPQIQFQGFGGLGLSEGKFNYSTQFGGNLAQKIGINETEKLMHEVDAILCQLGAKNSPFYNTKNAELAKLSDNAQLEMLATSTRHLGTQQSQSLLITLRHYLADKVDFIFNCTPTKLTQSNHFYYVQLPNNGVVSAKNIIIATGNNSPDWLQQLCSNFAIKEEKTCLDMGLRIEMPYQQWHSLLSQQVEIKLSFEYLGRIATTYCMNPNGRIIRKYEKGLVMPDGQNCRETNSDTKNLNFTLFVRDMFTSQQAAFDYAYKTISMINNDCDRIIVQRLNDLKNQRSTLPDLLINNNVKPSLSATPGNLIGFVPKYYLAITLEFFDRLSKLLCTPIDPNTLLYAMDAKFFAPEKVISNSFETTSKGLFLAGDCSGITGSLSQAAASGLHIANYLD